MITTPDFVVKDGINQKNNPFDHLLENRIVLLFNEINDDLACSVIAQLLALESIDSDREICIYINSPGGSVSAGLGIYDTIKHLKCDVSTVCVGAAASMGAFLLAAGTKGKRYSLPNSEIMIHQLSSGVRGQATDIAIERDHILALRARMNKLLAEMTGKSVEQVAEDTERDHWMFPEEALAYGIIDKIID